MLRTDTATLLTCLAAALKLTDDSMRANLRALKTYHRQPDGLVPWSGQRGPRYVRIDGKFMLDFAGPLVLQGATTTCYCFLLYVAASIAVAAAAYAFFVVRSAANVAGALNGDPAAALEKVVDKLGRPSGASRFVDTALRTVFENTMASTSLLLQVAVAQAVVSAAVLAAMAVLAVALKPRWAVMHNKILYADARFLRQASAVSTASAAPFVGAVLFARTDRAARWKAAAWRAATYFWPFK